MSNLAATRPDSHLASPIEPIAWCALLAATLFYWVLAVNTLPFPPDSWSYYELSQTVFGGDFYYNHGIRQFQSTTPYSMSFPPLWPVLIALGGNIWPAGPALLPTLAVLLFWLTILALEFGFRHGYRQPRVGLFTGLGLLCLSPYLDELKWGGTLPLTLLLLSLACLTWLKQPSPRHALVLGLLAGLIYLLRFDAAPAVAGVLVIYLARGLYQTQGHDRRSSTALVRTGLGLAAPFLVAVALAMLPYTLYSLDRFDTLWASDNTRVALSSWPDVFVTDFYEHWPATAMQQPLAFINKVAAHSGPFLLRTLFNLLLPIALVAGVYFRFARPTMAAAQRAATDSLLTRLSLLLLAWSATLAAYWLTGYEDRRYYLPETLLLLMATTIVFNCLSGKARNGLLLVTLLVLGNEVWTQAGRADFNRGYLIRSTEQLRSDDQADGYLACYTQLGGEGRVMFLDDDTAAARMAAVTGIDTTLMPRNLRTLTPQQLQALANRFELRAIAIAADHSEQWLPWFEAAGFSTERCSAYPGFYTLSIAGGYYNGSP